MLTTGLIGEGQTFIHDLRDELLIAAAAQGLDGDDVVKPKSERIVSVVINNITTGKPGAGGVLPIAVKFLPCSKHQSVLVKLDFETKISPALTGEINHMATKLTKEIRKIKAWLIELKRCRKSYEEQTMSKSCYTLLIREDNRRHDIDGEELTGFKEKYATDPSAFCKLARGPERHLQAADVGSEIKQIGSAAQRRPASAAGRLFSGFRLEPNP